MRVSFCTTVHNRLPQFARTFDHNASRVLADPGAEWIVLNFNSSDRLDQFMAERLPCLPPRVVYARDMSGRRWHVSVAKNIAHRLASGEALMNLDADQRVLDAADVLRRHLGHGVELLHLWNRVKGEGTYGKIAITRELFYRLGGYDESFYPMGYQDEDLLRRAEAAGARTAREPCARHWAIRNTKVESIEHCRVGSLTWRELWWLNLERSKANIAEGTLTANRNAPWGVLVGDCESGHLQPPRPGSTSGTEQADVYEWPVPLLWHLEERAARQANRVRSLRLRLAAVRRALPGTSPPPPPA
jgi:hypothetical protein